MKTHWTKRYYKERLKSDFEIIEKVDNLILNNLKLSDQRTLNVAIRSKHVITKLGMLSLLGHYDGKIDNMDKNTRQNYELGVIVHDLYKKAGVNDIERIVHWNIKINEQIVLKHSYKHVPDLPKQDNKSYINYGNGNSSMGKIRFPSKKRKTAWKRFYKLFPFLNPELTK